MILIMSKCINVLTHFWKLIFESIGNLTLRDSETCSKGDKTVDDNATSTNSLQTLESSY